MAIGLDTSVVLRLLIGEPRVQMEVAHRRIESAPVAGEQVVATDLVVAEAFHALRHHYGVPEAVALGQLREFLGSGIAHVDPTGLREALGPGTRGQAGLVDRLCQGRGLSQRSFSNQAAKCWHSSWIRGRPIRTAPRGP